MTINWHQLAAFGFSVFALRPRDKRPTGPWDRFQREHASPAELQSWSETGDLNAAIATGAVSGIIVLDTDSDAADVEVKRRGIPRTAFVRTSKGHHYYFKHPGGQVRNFAGRVPGCDLRGDGGYVVAPGSIHPSGHVYTWELSPADAAIADAPDWLLDLVKAKPAPAASIGDNAYAEAALDRELGMVRRAAEGTRNDTLNRAAFNLGQLIGAGRLSDGIVRRLLLSTAVAIGLSEHEAQATIASGMRDGMAAPRQVPERQSRPARSGIPYVPAERARRELQQSQPLAALKHIDPIAWQGKPIPERRWIVPDWIPDQTVTGLYGDGGVGKSQAAMQLATACAVGKPWLGKLTKACRVIGFFCEDPPDELQRRQAAINQHYDVEMGDLENLRLYSRVADDNTMMLFGPDGLGVATELLHKLTIAAADFGAQLVIIDTLADVFAGNENIRNQAKQFISALVRLAQTIDGAVVLCAHPSVAGMASGHGSAGTTGWSNAVRSRLYLEYPPKDEHESDREPSATAERFLTRKKANYAASGDTIELTWSQGVFVPKAGYAGGGILDTIERNRVDNVFLECLAKLNEKGIDVTRSPNSPVSYAPKVMLQLLPAKTHGLKVRDLEQAMGRLFGANRVRLDTTGSPSRGKKRIVQVERNP